MLMYWYIPISVVLERLSDHHLRILDALLASESGLSFNRLVDSLRGRVSRSVISREVRRLVEEGLIRTERDARHRQRILYRLDGRIRELAVRILGNVGRAGRAGMGVEEAVERISGLIRRYGEVSRGLRDGLIAAYLRHRVLEEVREILLAWGPLPPSNG